MENLKETQGDTEPFIDVRGQKQIIEKKNPHTILGISLGDVLFSFFFNLLNFIFFKDKFLQEMTRSLNNTKPGLENIFKLGVNVLFLVVIILFSQKKTESKNLLESVAYEFYSSCIFKFGLKSVTDTLNSHFEIIYHAGLPELNLSNYTTISERYGAKLDFLVTGFTDMLYTHGYAPFYKGLIHQTKVKNISCAFNDVLKYDFHLCVDPALEERNVINNDDSLPQNVWKSIYGLTGFFLRKKAP